MRILADENCDRAIVVALRNAGHDVTYMVEEAPGSDDESVLERARGDACAG